MHIDNYDFETLVHQAGSSLAKNGTYIPEISRIVFNLKTDEEINVLDEKGDIVRVPVIDENGAQVYDSGNKPAYKNKTEFKPLAHPVLATTVYFRDNTKVTVKNSVHDPITVIDVKLDADGNTTNDNDKTVKVIKVADDASKERAISYAILKRVFADVDEHGKCQSTGLSRILSTYVTNAFDQGLESAKSKLQKTAAKKRHLAQMSATSKSKPKYYSNADVIQLLGPILEQLNGKLAENPNVINDVIKALSARD